MPDKNNPQSWTKYSANELKNAYVDIQQGLALEVIFEVSTSGSQRNIQRMEFSLIQIEEEFLRREEKQPFRHLPSPVHLKRNK